MPQASQELSLQSSQAMLTNRQDSKPIICLIIRKYIHTLTSRRKQVEDNLGISLETCIAKYLELAKLSQTKKDYNTAKQCIDSIAKVMDYNPKEKVQRTENKVQFELLLKQLDSLPEVKQINPIVTEAQA